MKDPRSVSKLVEQAMLFLEAYEDSPDGDAGVVRVNLLVDAASAVRESRDMPRIVCLCGSTRFYKEFQEANYRETMRGRIVLSVGFLPHQRGLEKRHGEDVGCTPQEKLKLDELHKRKIDLSDEVLVLNVGGYIGESTRSELQHALATGKPVRFLEPVKID